MKTKTAVVKLDAVDEFGIRQDGDRAAVLMALLRAGGKPRKATDLAKLTKHKTERRVYVIARRIAIKAAHYKLPYKLVRDTDANTYALERSK